MTELKDVIETLDQAADSFDGIATKEQKKIYDEVIVLAKDLETDVHGKVKQSIANLKRLTQIKAKLAALSKDKEWVAGITHFAQYFGHLQKMQNEYYSQHFTESTIGMNAQKKNQLMREMAVQNTMEALMGDGLKANVTDKLNDILLRAVTSGAKFADLQDELRAHLMGENGGKGAFARYATTYATTALSQFAGQTNKLMTDDLGLEWFMYTGSNKETTREFCEHLTAKKYIHKSEIPTILTGKIDDYQCAIYEKTGLPLGMIAGTTPENFQCNCGGWNCRHQLVPVHELAVPANIRAKFKQIRPKVNEPMPPTIVKSQADAVFEYLSTNHDTKIGIQELNDAYLNGGADAYYSLLEKSMTEIINKSRSKATKERFARLMRMRQNKTEDYIQSESVEVHDFKDISSFENGAFETYKYKTKCTVYTTKSGMKIYVPTGLDKSRNPISVSQIEESILAMPQSLRNCIDYFQLVDFANPADEWWRVKYNYGDKKFESFATDGRKITYFGSEGNDKYSVGMPDEEFPIEATWHEAGHSFDNEHGITKSGEWRRIIEQEVLITQEPDIWISSYARQSMADKEDFADSVEMMIKIGEMAFRLKHPLRWSVFKKYGLI